MINTDTYIYFFQVGGNKFNYKSMPAHSFTSIRWPIVWLAHSIDQDILSEKNGLVSILCTS